MADVTTEVSQEPLPPRAPGDMPLPLRSLIEAGVQGIVFALSNLVFIDSVGVVALLRTARRLRAMGGDTVICCLSTRIAKVLRLVNLRELISFAVTQEQALAMLTARRFQKGPERG